MSRVICLGNPWANLQGLRQVKRCGTYRQTADRSVEEVKQVEGLPSYFTDFRRLLGAKSIIAKTGQVDTGDVVESILRIAISVSA